jgi:hypothetical protein
MNKNFVIIGIGAAALLVVLGLFLFSPKSDISSLQPLEQTSASSASKHLSITIKEHEKMASAIKTTKKKAESKKRPKKKRDPSIKAATIDHYHTYLIELIDKNPEDRDIKLQKEPDTYTYIEGKVSGKEFVMRVPKAVLDKPGVKLKIVDLKTKKSKMIDASFLSEAASLPRGSQFRVDIDFDHPDNIQTDTKLPEEHPAFPGLQ